MSAMKIVLFANSMLANQSMQLLVQNNLLAGLVLAKPIRFETEVLANQAKQAGIPVLLVEKKRLQPTLESWLNRIQPHVAVVVTFPHRIPARILSRVPMGFYNFHAARLPQYRGAEPTFWEIRNREPFGAVTIHKMDEEFDTGPLALVQQVPVNPEDTYGLLRSKLASTCAQMMGPLIDGLARNMLPLTPQDPTDGKYWPRPSYPDLLLRFDSMDAAEIRAVIKASNPWNKGALTFIRHLPVKITETSYSNLEVGNQAPGTIIQADPEQGTVVACRDGKALKLEILFLETEGFLTGAGFARLGVGAGERFEES